MSPELIEKMRLSLEEDFKRLEKEDAFIWQKFTLSNGFGTVRCRFMRKARTIRAHWREGCLFLSLPSEARHRDVKNFFLEYGTRILEIKPRPVTEIKEFEPEPKTYNLGYGPVLRIISSASCSPYSISRGPDGRTVTVNLPEEDLRLDLERQNLLILRIFKVIGRDYVSRLNKVFEDVCRRTGFEVTIPDSYWGVKQLGKCDIRGNISLSRVLVYYPDELQEYVMCHELAHRSFHDHSKGFHAECDRLCHLNFAGRSLRLPEGTERRVSLEKMLESWLKKHVRALPFR